MCLPMLCWIREGDPSAYLQNPLCADLSSQILYPANSTCLSLPGLLTPFCSTQSPQVLPWVLPSLCILAWKLSEYSKKGQLLGSLCFLFLKGSLPFAADVQCLENHHFCMFCLGFTSCLSRSVNLVPVTPFWQGGNSLPSHFFSLVLIL